MSPKKSPMRSRGNRQYEAWLDHQRVLRDLNGPVRRLQHWYPLANDPGLHAAGVEVGARAYIQDDVPIRLRIVFRTNRKEASVKCVHVAVYTGSIETLPPETELARSFELYPAPLTREEHFFALKSFVAGIAEVGIGAMFTAARAAGNQSVGFNSLMQQQVLRALLRVAPAAALDMYLWVMDDMAKTGGQPHQEADSWTPVKNRVANVLRKVHLPPEGLARLAGDVNGKVREAVALEEQTPPEVLARLAGDADADVRSGVARNQQTPPDVLVRLARDDNEWVRKDIGRNQLTPPEVIVRLANDEGVGVRCAIAHNPHTPPDVLTRLAKDADARVREAVVWNEQISPDDLTRLANDEDVRVRVAAQSLRSS